MSGYACFLVQYDSALTSQIPRESTVENLIRPNTVQRNPDPSAHCRRNHFLPSLDRIAVLSNLPSFPSDPTQRATTLIDLYLVSVLLDAGAGPDWTYTEKDERGNVSWKGGRSEGLAVASWHMFVDGVFSGDKSKPLQVDGESSSSDIVAIVLPLADTETWRFGVAS